MNTPLTRALLRDRALEIGAYVRFLQAATTRDAAVATDGKLLLVLDKDLTHTLKANLYLLIYNTVEATMTQLVLEMHDAIGGSGKTADDLCPELFLHLMNRFRAARSDVTGATVTQPIGASLVARWLHDYADQKRGNYLFSGNLDGLEIHNVLRKYGVVPGDQKKPVQSHTHWALQKAKDNRNDLAHGSISFRDLGNTLGVDALGKEAFAALRTLLRIVRTVDAYIGQKRYLKAPPPP